MRKADRKRETADFIRIAKNLVKTISLKSIIFNKHTSSLNSNIFYNTTVLTYIFSIAIVALLISKQSGMLYF